MSVKSLPIPGKSCREHVRESSSDGGVVIPRKLRRSSRLKMANTRCDLEVKEPKGREQCLNLEPGTLVL